MEAISLGIDVYMSWDNMTPAEEAARFTSWRVDAGEVGYLREAYHGAPYATQVLVPEAFATAAMSPDEARDAGYEVDEERAVYLPAATLRARLDDTCATVIARARKVYGEELTPDSPEVRAFVDFVELYERLEREARHPRVYASY